MKHKILNIVITIIAVIAILFAIMAMWAVLTTEKGKAPQLFGCSVLRVVSGSMEPAIPTGSVVIAQTVDAESLKVDDVISYYSRDPAIKGVVNTHRIVEIDEVEGNILFVTKGDANDLNDFFGVYEEDILGKVIFCSYLLGLFVTVATNIFGFIVIVLLPLLLIIIYNVKDIVRLIRQEATENYEQELKDEQDKG